MSEQAAASQPTQVTPAQISSPEANQPTPQAQPQVQEPKQAEPKEKAVDVDELVKGSYKRFEEAAKLKKEAESILNRLESDPSFLDERPDLARKLEDYYVQKLAKEARMAELSPTERELWELKEEKARRLAEEKKKEEESRNQRIEELAVQYAESLEAEMVEALTGSGLPQTPRTVKLMAYHLKSALEAGYTPTRSQLLKAVKADYNAQRGEVVSEWDSYDDDRLIEAIGEERARKISRAYVKRLRGKQAPAEPGQPVPGAVEKLRAKGDLSVDELMKLSDKERFEILHGPQK